MAEKETKSKNVFSDDFTRIENVDKAVELLETLAVPFRKVEFAKEKERECFDKEFNYGILKTPIGKVKINYNQFTKLEIENRLNFLGLIKPTLEKPLIIITSKDKDGKENDAFIKTFKDGEILYFVSFVNTDEELGIMVSGHSRRKQQIESILSKGKVISIANKLKKAVTALLGTANYPKPRYKTLLISLNLEYLPKDTKTKQNNATKMAKKHTLRQGTKLIQSLNSLDGVWSDNKEKFKVTLLNDIKSFLFTKWEKPWLPKLPFNRKGEVIPLSNIYGRPYTGSFAAFTLQGTSKYSPYFVTPNYVKKHGGKITNNEMISPMLNFIPVVKESDGKTRIAKDGEKADFALPTLNYVVSTDYVEGIKVPFYQYNEFKNNELNLYIEKIITEIERRKCLPKINYDQRDACFYRFTTDEIHMVEPTMFENIEKYYSAIFHEIIHSTRSEKRLGRSEKIKEGKKNENHEYAAEELVAEMGAYILCAELGLNYFRDNSISYLKGWLKNAVALSGMKEDDVLLEAYGYAVDAVEYLLKGIDVEKLIPAEMKTRVKRELKAETKTTAKKEEKPDVKPKTEPKKTTAIVKKKVEQKPAKKSSKIDIVDYPIKDISTDVKRFQNRQNEYSKESKERIVKAFDENTFDWAKFDPITLWEDPKNNKVYVLSGHSRFAAFKEKQKEGFVYNGYKFDTIPAKFFNGTEKQAIDFALNSNVLSTKETDIERAVYYSNMRRQCELSQLNGTAKRKVDCAKKVETKCRENEGKNANFILNLSFLNPDGKLMQSLKMFGSDKDNDNTNLLRTIANWTGEARRILPILTDKHENEISDFLINGGYGNKNHQFKNKTVFLEYLKIAVKKWESSGADVNTKLNLERTIYKSSYERDHDKQIHAAKEEMDSAIAEYDEKYKKYLSAVWDGEITQERMNELMLPLVAYAKKTRDNYIRVKGQKSAVIEASNRQGTLFGVDNIEEINRRFNEELDLFISKKLSIDHVFYLGDMIDIFKPLRFERLPIKMTAQILMKKSKQKNHPFELNSLKDLPKKLSQPIMVFKSHTVAGSVVVLIELVYKDINYVVAIELDKNKTTNKGRSKINVHSVSSLYPKDIITGVLNWIEKYNLLLWRDKTKSLDLMNKWHTFNANIKQQIERCANIIKKFQNPTIKPK